MTLDDPQQMALQYSDQLDQLYQQGRRHYPTLPLERGAFAGRVLRAVLDRARERLADGEAVRGAIGAIRAADFYLASACEQMVAGAWETFERAYYPRIKGLARRYGALEEEAEELARSLSGELVEPPPRGRSRTRIGTYDGRGSLFAWLSVFIIRHLSDRARRRPPEAGDENLDSGVDSSAQLPPQMVVSTETSARLTAALRDALLDLSTREYLIVKWLYVEEHTQSEVARRLEISVPRVHQIKSRAEGRLRDSVRRTLQEDSFSQWPSRDWLWGHLKGAVAELLGGGRW